jgi:Holliday junction resolvase
VAKRLAKNTNRQGANFELRIMADLTRHGYIAHRSSGSHGAVDVVAIGELSTLWIQAKISQATIPLKERQAVLALVTRAGASAAPLTASRTPGGVADWLPWEPEPLRWAPCAVESCLHDMGWHNAEGCWAGPATCTCRAFELQSLTS